LSGGWITGLRADQEPPRRHHARAHSPAQLVPQLGHPNFAVRTQAMDELVAWGVEAIDALEAGLRSPDREVRFRSQRALELVRAQDFQRRLQVFAAGQDAQEQYQLPAWDLFRKQVGDSQEARRLFVEMQQAEPDMLLALDNSSLRAEEVLVERLGRLQQDGRIGQNAPLPLGTIASFLFVAIQPRGDDAPPALQQLTPVFRQDVFASAMQIGAQREVLGKMLGVWIERASSWETFHAMLLAMQYDLPQGLVPAQRLLQSDATDPNQAVYRGFALQMFARFGDASHMPIVEPFLEDTTPYGQSLNLSGTARYQTQIRDIALATLVHLAKENPQRFGLLRLKPSSSQVFNPNSVAFENDARRDEAIRAWRAFRESIAH
jgi:hypothetical protein